MPPTLASLVRHPGLKLSVLAGEDRLETPVRWAHVSELADPVPYMDGGELLLITAMQIEADDPEEMSRYVRRLVGAGVVGLGFALGVNYAEVPPALATAAKEEGLPLLGVPRRTPFIAISKAVSAAIAADQYRAVTAGFEAQRELTRAAIGAEGPTALLARLAAHLDGWAALYDVSGAVVAAAPDWAARRAARLTADVERLRSRPGPASIVVGGGCGPAGATGAEPAEDSAVADRVELQSLGTGRRTRGVLAVGTGAPLGTAERYAVHSAVALLTLTTERSRALQEAEQRLGAAVLRMLLAGEPDHARAVAGRLYGGLLDAPFRMLVAEVPSGGTAQQAHAAPSAADDAPAELPTEATTTAAGEAEAADPLGTLVDTMEAAAARIGESVLVVPDGERLIVLAPDGGAAVAACAEHARAVEDRRGTKARPRDRAAVAAPRGDELVIGLSAPAGPIAAAAAYRQAEQALSVARRRGRMLVEHEQVAAGSVLPLLADDAVRAFADGMLRALHEHDATGRGDLVASLRAWLSRHGQWDAAAADLGVHRHTLRYRMRRVEEILGRSLDDPDVRMELWLALKATAPGTSA
ncbi:PucR family transcriptional regulator [Streptomyces rapamycinicus]|uniref:PucR family transcriptional regulator n=2 Tax=Streptomyces rapamycinicus TaxID=1226757 RepID=A0A0A0NF17_STRRN|nr:PucR family transcriptional regulator [Streptomyces rapamycinicus]AGP54683.1 PucR family transcriptional regulator [Streptomyces rapamycinicus NRRL 5491]MBB4782200.1 purine catabolism regulator [Streptomyces rapamycinicus]RLV82316.1 PucR family transcriptional regulator [Streptomyces rapamycinicus NRRL 5491]UTO62732.1 PucR family transcriptional regulator [Streptomyces rapamycinicus]UTP30690.1 PucR family transcriptional regulator [Streptomyces rapamycinicus NRRL 5491]